MKMLLLSARVVWVMFITLCSTQAAWSQSAQLFLTPNSGIPGQTLDVVVRSSSSSFKSNVTQIDFGAGIHVLKPFAVSNGQTGTASIRIDDNAAPGFRQVKAATGTEEIISDNAFEVFTSGGAGNFRATLELLPFQSYNLSDLDVSNPQKQPIMYFVNLYNDNITRTIKISIALFTGKYGEVGSVVIDKKVMNPNEVIRITNRDFERYITKMPDGAYFLTAVKERGTFPPDDYTFKLSVTDASGNKLSEDDGKTIITNPVFNPEAISPGANFSSNPQKIYNAFPLFQWFGQADLFDIALYKVLPGQTPEEVVRNLPVFKADNVKGNNLLYPAYAERLTDGQMYAWQVRAKVVSSKGTQYLPSEVFRFMYTIESGLGDEIKKVTRLMVLPQDAELKPGEQVQVICQLLDKDDLPVPNVKPTWRVVPAIGTVNDNGLFTAGQNPGTCAVIAKYGLVEDYVTVIIKGKENGSTEVGQQWLIDNMLKQLFGLPGK